jgi:predicted MPP superfamily phosphohydrolase
MRFLIFFLMVLLILGGSYSYVGMRLLWPVALERWIKVVMFLLPMPLLFSYPLMRLLGLGGANDGGFLLQTARWTSYLSLGFFSFTFVLVAASDLGGLGARALALIRGFFIPELADKSLLSMPWDPQRRALLSTGVNAGILGVSGLLTGYGVVQARGRQKVKRVEIPIKGLPPALDGFKIAQISDVHVGPTIKGDFVDMIVEGVNALEPDMVALTGDLVDGSVAELGEHVARFTNLQSRHGTFFCTGNHEYYSGAEEWVEELRRLGMKVLLNESEVIEHQGGHLLVGGCTDYNAGNIIPEHESDPGMCLKDAPESDARILLAHQPRSIYAAAEAGFDLQLSGHTHGGQFIPWNFFVRLQQPYVAGLYRHDKTWVYVNQGTGYWGPPVRVGVPSEITLLTLRPAPGNKSAA